MIGKIVTKQNGVKKLILRESEKGAGYIWRYLEPDDLQEIEGTPYGQEFDSSGTVDEKMDIYHSVVT